MKKLALAVLAVLMVCGVAAADDLSGSEVIGNWLDKLPAVNAGCYYNVDDAKFEFTSTAKIASYKIVNLNVGMATEKTIVAGIGIDLVKLEQLGVKMDVLKDVVVDAGFMVGWKKVFDDNEINYGPCVTLKMKF
jgi:hypothetical protein